MIHPDDSRTGTSRCRICGATEGHSRYLVPEMMFGSGELFEYFQCGACECLQIAEFPVDISRYYPPGYYAFGQRPDAAPGVRRAVRRVRNGYFITGSGMAGRFLSTFFRYPYPGAHRWLGRNGVGLESRILDVGCGVGHLLYDLSVHGYGNLLGVDPFIEADIQYDTGLLIRKTSIHELDGTFDLIMLHHALEHVSDQLETLRAIGRLLDPTGECLIRIPIVSSYAWEHYRECWAQLDAPRHFFLHSTRSIRILGEQAGLELVHMEYDSTELQFAGSELYQKGLPLIAGMDAYSKRELREFRRRADELNRREQGDSAAFYFRKS